MSDESALPTDELCRGAAEVLARDTPDVTHVVYRPEGRVEAAAHVDTTNRRAFAAVEDGETASYKVYGRSPFDAFTDAGSELVREPFRCRVGRSGGAQSLPMALWDLAGGRLPGTDRVPVAETPFRFHELDGELVETAEAYMERISPEVEPPVTITGLEMTTPAAPAQWNGVTEDGLPVYIRYRGGRLQVRAGGRRGVDGSNIHDEQCGDAFDGALTIEEVIDIVPEETATFEIDTGDTEDFSDLAFEGADGLLDTGEEAYDRDGEFVKLCRHTGHQARSFADIFDGVALLDAYYEAHPAREDDRFPLEERQAITSRKRLMQSIQESLFAAADAVEEEGNYALAVDELSMAVSATDEAADLLTLSHGLPVSVDEVESQLLSVAGGEYQHIFDRVDALRLRAEAESEGAT